MKLNFAENIRKLRRENGFTQEQLAEKVGVSFQTVSRWETGRGMPAVDSLEPLAEVLGLSVSELLSGKRLTPEELPKAASPEVLKLAEEDRELYDALRALRGTIARDAGIPPYMVFSNATLADMARKKPRTGSQFRKVSGVGQIKAEWYADDFLGRIREFLETQG